MLEVELTTRTSELISEFEGKLNYICLGTSPVAQWLRLCTPNAGGLGSIPGQGTRSHMHAATKNSHAATKELTC